MNIVKGNLFKPLELQLTLAGAPFVINVGTDTMKLRWTVGHAGVGTVTEVVPTVVTAATGDIKHDFAAGQTDVVGVHYGQVTLTRAGKDLTFPDDGTQFVWNVHVKI